MRNEHVGGVNGGLARLNGRVSRLGERGRTARPAIAGDGPAERTAFRRRKRVERFGDLLLSTSVFVVLLALWELAARLQLVDPLFSSSPSRIWTAAIALVQGGDLGKQIAASAKVFLLGFGLAVAFGSSVPSGRWSRLQRCPETAVVGDGFSYQRIVSVYCIRALQKAWAMLVSG